MKLKQFIAKAMFAGGLGLTAGTVGLGMGTANADPPSPHRYRHRPASQPRPASG